MHKTFPVIEKGPFKLLCFFREVVIGRSCKAGTEKSTREVIGFNFTKQYV